MSLHIHKSSHPLRAAIILVMLAILAVMAFLYFSDKQRQNDVVLITQTKKMAVSHESAAAVKYGLPMRLLIPKLKVSAAVSYMGLTANGEMDVPPDLFTVGWYKFGTKPGEVGSAVIAGHLEGTQDKGVFINLDKLRSGDLVDVRNDRDEIVSFVVRDMRTYRQDERPNEVFNKTDGSYLNLITCSGTWDDAKHRYSHRYVVFTEKLVK